ncbi:TetR/AcrR family transcriptional regulator [Streptomyces sp. J2-1]|uniref:ScbR family autoregulator-binding transcription factor n=1 Tax=Streptomyces corallincola TaxID=2851888 RepID=UPI001C381701|nr:ScbR family autoregulator-binding transcription factor [Streptomyces corallincola]MBV2354056.1 TetR/AcrR family transcriptional regulator [Streptomyces corallincola]
MVKQARAARTRQLLLEAAAESFVQHGYTGASLPVISGRAGVSAGALHFHFPSKADLAAAVEDSAALRVRALTARGPSAGGGPLATLVTAIRELAAALRDEPVLRAGFTLGGDPARVGRAPALDAWHAWVRETAGRARLAGELADGVTPESVAGAVLAATVGGEVVGGRDRELVAPEHLLEFWTGLLPVMASGAAIRSSS